jgi:hypothetical protein
MVFAAIDRDGLLEALGSGFIAPTRLRLQSGECEQSGLPVSTRRPKHGPARDELVFLTLELPSGVISSSGSNEAVIPYPLPTAWVREAAFRNEGLVNEFLAIASTFPDLAPATFSLVTKAPGKSKKREAAPSQIDEELGSMTQLSLIGSVAPPESKSKGATLRGEIRQLDKLAGAVAGIVWGTPRSEVGLKKFSYIIRLITASGMAHTPAGALSLAWAALLGQGEFQADLILLEAAAKRLSLITPAEGMDTEEFVKSIVDDILTSQSGSDTTQRELQEFARGASDVLASRLELKPESLGDAGHVGFRGLLLFLLSPSPEVLERFLKRRPATGELVTVIAKALVGLYTGLAGLPGEIKAQEPETLSAIANLALALSRGEDPNMSITQEHEPDAAVLSSVLIDGKCLITARGAPDPAYRRIRDIVAAAGLDLEREQATGQILVTRSTSEVWHRMEVGIAESSARLPTKSCITLECKLTTTPQKFGGRLGLIAGLVAARPPIMFRITAETPARVSYVVAVEIEAATPTRIREAVSQLQEHVSNVLGSRQRERVPQKK